MLYALLKFNSMPTPGFAHHFYMENYVQNIKKCEKSLEIVYVKKGAIKAEIYGTSFIVEPGSIFIIFRDFPYVLSSPDNTPQEHSCIQLKFDYTLNICEEASIPPVFDGLILPIITPPGVNAEEIKKEIFFCISELGISRENNSLSAAATTISILSKLSKIKRSPADKTSLLTYKIKKYITENIGCEIPLKELALCLNKTPNYLNSVFHKTEGISIRQYINKERAKLIAELMDGKALRFKAAAESVGINDVSYAYRLFKKHVGLTPSEYLKGGNRLSVFDSQHPCEHKYKR